MLDRVNRTLSEETLLRAFASWLQRRREIRTRWQRDAQMLVKANEREAYYEAHRRSARLRAAGELGEFWHWSKVASEVARISPLAEMDAGVVQGIHDASRNRTAED